MDVIEAFFRRKGNYIGEHKKILEYFVMHIHVYKMNTKNLFSMLHYNTVMFQKSLGISLQSIERSRKNINEKELQENKKIE